MSQTGIKVLYIDDTCKIVDGCIIIKKYYFPLATSRTIAFNQISRISIQDVEVNHPWGPSLENMNNWFPLDSSRKNKGKFIAVHLKGKKIVPCFTPLNAEKVYSILKSHLQKDISFSKIQFTQNLQSKKGRQSKYVRNYSFGEQSQDSNKQPLMELTKQNRINHL